MARKMTAPVRRLRSTADTSARWLVGSVVPRVHDSGCPFLAGRRNELIIVPGASAGMPAAAVQAGPFVGGGAAPARQHVNC
jgi:hypothetical protein